MDPLRPLGILESIAFERIEVPLLSVYQPKRCRRQFRLARHPFDEIVFRVKIHRVAQGINQ